MQFPLQYWILMGLLISNSTKACLLDPIDLVFILDSSWSIRSISNFRKELRFVSDVVRTMNLLTGDSTVTIITFGDYAEIMLRSQDFSIENEFLKEVMNIKWTGGNTYTNKALELMYEEMRNTGRRVVGVMVTDGGSTDPLAVENVLRKIQFVGFQMFAIGVGRSINREELEKIASDEKFHLFMVGELNGLKAIVSTLKSRICSSQNAVQNVTMCVEESGVLNFTSSLPRVLQNIFGNTMLKSNEIESFTFYHNNRAIIICNFSIDTTEHVRSDMNVSQDYNLVFKLIEASYEGTYTRLLTFENGRIRRDVIRLLVKDPCLRIQKLSIFKDSVCRNVTCLTSPGGSLSLKGRMLPSLKANVCIGMNNDGTYQCCSRTGNCESKAVTLAYTTNTACASENVTLDVYFQDGLKGKIIGSPLIEKILENGLPDFFLPDKSGKGLLSFFTEQFIEIVGFYRPRLRNVQKRDEGLFNIEVRTQKEGPMHSATVKLVVNDPCFHTAELNNATHCYETKCLTSKNGTLMFEGMEQNSFEVKVCNNSEYGMYNCCSPTNECISQYIHLDAEELDPTPQIATTTSVTEKPVNSVIWIIGSVMAAILIAVVIVTALMKYRRSDRGRKVYFGVDGRNVVVDPYNTPGSLNDEEEYASLSENEILPDDQIQTISTMQAPHNPYEDLKRCPEENEYQAITRNNQDADERCPDKDSAGVKMTNEEKAEENELTDDRNRHSQPTGVENTADVDYEDANSHPTDVAEQNRHSQPTSGDNMADVADQNRPSQSTDEENITGQADQNRHSQPTGGENTADVADQNRQSQPTRGENTANVVYQNRHSQPTGGANTADVVDQNRYSQPTGGENTAVVVDQNQYSQPTGGENTADVVDHNRHSQPTGGANTADVVDQNRHSQPTGGENIADIVDQNRHSQPTGGENTANEADKNRHSQPTGGENTADVADQNRHSQPTGGENTADVVDQNRQSQPSDGENTADVDDHNRHSQPTSGESTSDVDDHIRHNQSSGGENSAGVDDKDVNPQPTMGGNMSHDEEHKTD